MLRAVRKHGGEIGICGTCMDARGLGDADLTDVVASELARRADRVDRVGGQREAASIQRAPRAPRTQGGSTSGLESYNGSTLTLGA